MPLGTNSQEGDLLVIGGAEDKLGKRTVLKEFVARAGGPDARIAVVPTASSLGPEIIEVYEALFKRLGAAEVYGVRPENRSQASDPALVRELERATGDLHDRRQPAQALHRDRRNSLRRGDPGRACSGGDHRWHLGRREHPVLPRWPSARAAPPPSSG